MFWLFAVTWLHVLLGILWFGSTLYINLILIPAVLPLPRAKQQEIAAQVSPLTTRVLRPTAILVILLGVVRGTFFGPLHSVQDVVSTTYGVTWLLALAGTLVLYALIELLFDPAITRLNTSTSDAEYAATLGRVKIYAVVELLGFFAIFTAMIFLRYGL